MHTLFTFITATVLSVGNFLGLYHAPVAPIAPAQPTKALQLGDFNPTAGGTYRLQSSIGSSDTNLTLTSFKEPVSGIAYTMAYLASSIEYATLEPQSNNKEFISFTGITQNSDGSATLTGITRGLSFSYPFTASSTLQLTHSGQTILILSNSPQFYTQFARKANNETITGTWTFNSFPVTPSTPAATPSVAGFTTIATGAQAAASTANASGPSGTTYVLPTSIATSTFNSATAGNVVPVTGGTGKLDNNFIATSTLYGANASSTVLTQNGSGVPVWAFPNFTLLTSTTTAGAMASATTTISTTATHLKIYLYHAGCAGAAGPVISFNSDSGPGGANYAYREGENGVFTSASANNSIAMLTTSTTSPILFNIDVENVLANRKFLTWTGVSNNSGANAPFFYEGSGVWNNTSARISTIVLSCNLGLQNVNAGSTIAIYASSF